MLSLKSRFEKAWEAGRLMAQAAAGKEVAACSLPSGWYRYFNISVDDAQLMDLLYGARCQAFEDCKAELCFECSKYSTARDLFMNRDDITGEWTHMQTGHICASEKLWEFGHRNRATA